MAILNSKEIDILNVFLIVVSLALAFNLPFQLFLFSYAFLGPLHYLTEINWLKEKNYFLKETKWIVIFIFLAFLVTVPYFLRANLPGNLNEQPLVKNISTLLNKSSDEIVMFAVLLALGLIYFKNKLKLLLFLAPSTVVTYLALHYFPDFALAMAVFIPTIIHVYLFTLLFMIYGTLNSKSTPGIIAIVLVILVPVIIMLSKVNLADYIPIRETVVTSFNDSGFGMLNLGISKFLLPAQEENFTLLSVIGIKTQIFIAFAYTYHYLNWFSKTSVIGWNKNLSKTKVYTILIIWAVSVALYIYSFKIGFMALLLLSLVHVFLEFPLNMTSIKGILQKIGAK
ncbi:hypothetical protein [Flavobacterium sp. XGLA_31]|uniref:hypothetical protein n=1 Tax=Flavobacterium sp. XGLA_31 TaxID=3447666 RepID=UPI003F3A08F0